MLLPGVELKLPPVIVNEDPPTPAEGENEVIVGVTGNTSIPVAELATVEDSLFCFTAKCKV